MTTRRNLRWALSATATAAVAGIVLSAVNWASAASVTSGTPDAPALASVDTAGGLSGEALAELRAALDPERPAPPLSEADARVFAAKDAAAKASWAQASGQKDGSKVTPQCIPELCGVPKNDAINNVVQVAQERGYWCGPAALVSALKSRGVNITQGAAASRLGTTSNGTDWYNGRYPMEAALDSYLSSQGANYTSTAVSGNPTASQRNAYKAHIYENTKNNWPTLGDAYEVVGGPHLAGHPNQNIFHWFMIYGYSNHGEGTNYADPAAGASSVSWGRGVPRYSNMSSNTIVTIMGGRGYVW